jgi:hypothetical protein
VRRIHFKTFADSTYVTEELQDAALPQQSTFSATVTARQKASKINALFIVFTYTTHNHSGASRSSLLTATTLCSVLRRGQASKRFVLATKNTKQNTSGYRFIIDTGHPTTRCLVDRRTPSHQLGVASGAFVNHISVLCHSRLVMCRLCVGGGGTSEAEWDG